MPRQINILCLILHFWVFLIHCHGSEVSFKLLTTPRPSTNRNFAKFAFEVLVGATGHICANFSTYCKLDDCVPAVCEGGKVSYTQLLDGNHTFQVCTNGSLGVGCAQYNWTVDTIPPTAYITTPTSFTNASNVSVDITFTEPCWSQGGFGCSSTNSCNLLVYGAGQVVPNTLNVIEPGLKFSVVVSLSTRDQYGRVILVMDKNFCSDPAGNKFTRTENSSLFINFDRRAVLVDIRTHIPERLLQIDSEMRTVLATNSTENMEVYLYFTEPISNSSTEILNSLSITQGLLTPISGNSLGERRFGFQVRGISQTAIVTLSVKSDLILSWQGTSIAPVANVTFLYDMQRPAVMLSTTSRMRTREEQIPVLINFVKPVFGFNSSHVSISGGKLQSFQEMSRSMYTVYIQARDDFVSVIIPENVTGDVAGNPNLQSNILRLKHYTVPTISEVLSIFSTAAFVVTCFAAGLLTVSTASLQSVGAYSRPSSLMTSDPARNLFRIACHIQFFALARWFPVTLPVEYYEFARGLQWSIPYFSLPWETGSMHSFMMGPGSPTNSHLYGSKIRDFGTKPDKYNVSKAAALSGLPLTPMQYRSIFTSQDLLPKAQYIVDPEYSNGWRDFNRSMFWLAVIGGSLILLHAWVLLVLKLRKDREKKWSYGALVFPRFEIFLTTLVIPSICKASVNIVKGGSPGGIAVGILLLGLVSFLLLALFLFLSIGITSGKLLQYKEVHHVGQNFHWYEELVRVTLGPGKRGQWTWKSSRDSRYLVMFGPLFEDLRGPPKYMLSQIIGGNSNKHPDKVIATDDETEDAEAPFIQKVFGILRIYFTFLEFVKRLCLGIVAGTYLKNWSSKSPIVALLTITSFQLFFMVLKKPFIKKKVQLAEIISIACETGFCSACIVLRGRDSSRNETPIGITMLALFFIAFLPQLVNEWHALYRQTKRLGADDKSFFSGLKAASIGFLLFFIPQRLLRKLESGSALLDRVLNETGDVTSSADRNQSSDRRSSGTDRPWHRQFRELAKSSFSKDSNVTTSDPSTSRVRWSGFWNPKRSGSSSKDSSADKSKARGLYKDLEAIFASKSETSLVNTTMEWRDFERSMFWLAVIGGSLILLHAWVLLVLKLRKDREKKWSYGALVFPRFEIFLTILAIPSICKASVNIVKGGSPGGIAAGILLLGLVSFLLLALFLFLSIGITSGKLLQYKEVHHVGQKFHWYEELVRVTLGPGKRGQWTWKSSRDSRYLVMFGPLFEDLRGPPKYMLSQIIGGNSNKHPDKVIATDDETEDAEAPFIQKVFGILRIYFTFLEFVKRLCLGIVAGTYLKNWSSKSPIVALLTITSFQLFFMVLKKPFIKKKVQLVEIISIACETGFCSACIVLIGRDSSRNETPIGITMLALFFIAFLSQLVNEWHALYRQTKRLGADDKSFCSGLKAASIGFLLFFIPQRLLRKLESGSALLDRVLRETGDVTSSADRNRSSDSRSSGTDRPWHRQFRELAKSSFSKDSNVTTSDPSTSRVRWSGFWNPKRSGSSSKDSSADKSKARGLYKDLEAIFASKSETSLVNTTME